MPSSPRVIVEPPPPAFEGRLLPNPHEPASDQGLQFDVETLLTRRQVLRALGSGAVGARLFTVVGCDPSGATGTAGVGSPTSASSGRSSGRWPMA